MQAALHARTDPATVIVGRTSAISITGLDDAVRRAAAYAKAGVDAMFLTGVSDPDEVAAVRAATGLPIILGGTAGELGDRAAMAALGVRVALQGHHPFMAAVRATYETLKALREGVAPGALGNQPSAELMRTLTRQAEYDAAAKAFLGG
jgi:carboxyvinyl-carboxyphosphonate phosphorylmutase